MARGGWRIACAAFALCVADVAADTVSLRNGDIYTGTVKSLQGGQLIFQSAYGAPLTLPWGEVIALETEGPVKLVVEGRAVDARIGRWDAGGLVLRRDDGTEERYPAPALEAIQPPPVLTPAWSGYAELGAKTTHGNKDTEGATVGGELVWKGEADKLTLKTLFRYAEVDRRVTERSTYANGKYDLGLGGSLYGFGAEELLSDKFKDLRVRSITSAGLGYAFCAGPPVSLSMETGYAWVSEHFVEADNARASSLRFSGSVKCKLSEWVGLEDAFQLYPSLERSHDYKGRNEASLLLKLGANWGLRIGSILEYDSRPPSREVERVDLTHLVTVQYRF